MAETLVAPDAVALSIAWLAQELPDMPDQTPVTVTRAVPNPRPPTFVTVRLIGGEGRNGSNVPLDRPQVAIEAWAQTPAQAHDLAQNARAVMHAARGVVHAGTQVYRVEEMGAPVDLPDPLSHQPRVTFSLLLTVRIRRPQGMTP